MKKALLLGAAMLLWSGSARADLPVIDIAGNIISMQQLASALRQAASDETMIVNQVTQITHLANTVNAVMHGDVLALADLGPELSALGIGELVSPGAGGTELLSAVSGVAVATGRLTAVANNLMQQDTFYLPTASDWSAGRMISQARSYAAQKALAQTSFSASASQITALRAARDKASAAGDVTAAAQANAALAGVAAQAQLEGNQLQAASMLEHAQEKTTRAQTQQMSRCSFERLAANAQAAQAAADSGTIQFLTDVPSNCAASTTAGTAVADASGTAGTAVADASASAGLATGYDGYIGQSVGTGQCVALVQAADSSVGLTATWVQGEQVAGATNLQPGTPIATFNSSGQYANATDGSSHAAIYLGQDANGIQVEDQWLGQPAHIRTISFNSSNTAANNGGAFYVIGHAS